MSKGEVVEHLGDCRYRVRQKLSVEKIQLELAQVSERLAELAIELPQKKLELVQAETAVTDKAREIDELIPDMMNGVPGALQKITALQVDLIRLQSAASQAKFVVSNLIAEDLANRKRQNRLESVPEDREMEVWCADYTEELSGEIGLIDVNDEGGQLVLAQPGFESAASYLPARDGGLFPDLAQSGAQIYFNAALLPGVQKWRPRYRVATISNINGDRCVIFLDAAASSAQGLNINAMDMYSDVPIQYMDCNGAAFEDGDKVMVRFFESGPQVIGFADGPKPCILPGFAFIPALAEPELSEPVTYGAPFRDAAGNPINPNLGSQGSAESAWLASYKDDQYRYLKGRAPLYGNMNWKGPDDLVISWDGAPSRMFDYQYAETSTGWRESWNLGNRLYCRNRLLFEFAPGIGNGKDLIVGAALHAGSLLMVTVDDVDLRQSPTFAIYRLKVNETLTRADSPEKLHTYTPPESMIQFRSGFYFTESGSLGVCTLREDNHSRVYALRVSEEHGFTRETVYDAWGADSGINYSELECTYTVNRVDNQDNDIGDITWDQTHTTYEFQVEVPLYFDVRGEDEIAVYHSLPPRVTVNASAGTNNLPKSAMQSSRTITETVSGNEKIITSDGEVLAEITVGRSRSYSLTLTPIGPDSGNTNISFQNSYTDRAGFDHGYLMFHSLHLNARDRVCVTVMEVITYSGSGTREDAWAETINGFDWFYNLPNWHAETTYNTVMESHVGGVKVSSDVVDSFTFEQNGRLIMDDLWGPPDYLNDKTGSGTISETTMLDGPTTTVNNSYAYEEFKDFGGAEHAGRRAVSAVYQSDAGITTFQHIDEAGDPVTSIFGKEAGEPYVMHRLALV